jgi:hypothetical protein
VVDGEESLHSLDTAVHQKMIQKESFIESTLSGMSATLTTRVLAAIQPLLDQQPGKKTSDELRISIESIMLRALRIRSLSLIGDASYESIFPPLGSTINDDEMEAKEASAVNSSAVVRLTFCPGIRAYSKKKSMVQYEGFTGESEDTLEQMYSVKALVLQ